MIPLTMKYIKISIFLIINFVKTIPPTLIKFLEHESPKFKEQYETLSGGNQKELATCYKKVLMKPADAASELKKALSKSCDIVGLYFYVLHKLLLTMNTNPNPLYETMEEANLTSEDIETLMPYCAQYMKDNSKIYNLLQKYNKNIQIDYTSSKNAVILNPLLLILEQSNLRPYVINNPTSDYQWKELIQANPLALRAVREEMLKSIVEDDAFIESIIESKPTAIEHLSLRINRNQVLKNNPIMQFTTLIGEQNYSNNNKIKIFVDRYLETKKTYKDEIEKILLGNLTMTDAIEFLDKTLKSAPDKALMAANLVGFALLKTDASDVPKYIEELAKKDKQIVAKMLIYNNTLFEKVNFSNDDILQDSILRKSVLEGTICRSSLSSSIQKSETTRKAAGAAGITDKAFYNEAVSQNPAVLQFARIWSEEVTKDLCQKAIDEDIMAAVYVPWEIAIKMGKEYEEYIRTLIALHHNLTTLDYRYFLNNPKFAAELYQITNDSLTLIKENATKEEMRAFYQNEEVSSAILETKKPLEHLDFSLFCDVNKDIPDLQKAITRLFASSVFILGKGGFKAVCDSCAMIFSQAKDSDHKKAFKEKLKKTIFTTIFTVGELELMKSTFGQYLDKDTIEKINDELNPKSDETGKKTKELIDSVKQTIKENLDAQKDLQDSFDKADKAIEKSNKAIETSNNRGNNIINAIGVSVTILIFIILVFAIILTLMRKNPPHHQPTRPPSSPKKVA